MILGVMQFKSEDFYIAKLAIIHVLDNIVDHLILIEHNSGSKNDEISCLLSSSVYSELITYISYESQVYPQDLISNLALKTYVNENYKWIYFFDADEFLFLTEDILGIDNFKNHLRSFLESVPNEIQALQYNLVNVLDSRFMDNFDLNKEEGVYEIPFNESLNFNDFRHLNQIVLNLQSSLYEVTKARKLIIRNLDGIRIGPGYHAAWVFEEAPTVQYVENICAMHFMLDSEDRMNEKLLHGKRLLDQGKPEEWGWQNTVVYKIFQKGDFEKFKQIHFGYEKLSINHRMRFNKDFTTHYRDVQDKANIISDNSTTLSKYDFNRYKDNMAKFLGKTLADYAYFIDNNSGRVNHEGGEKKIFLMTLYKRLRKIFKQDVN